MFKTLIDPEVLEKGRKKGCRRVCKEVWRKAKSQWCAIC